MAYGPPSQLPTNPLAMQGPPGALPTAPIAGMTPPTPPPQQGGGLQGLLGNQSDLHNLAGNPLFNIGMSLLQSQYDPRVNPFQAVMAGLKSAGSEQRTREDRAREQDAFDLIEKYLKADDEDRERIKAFMGVQAQGGQTAMDNLISPSVQRGLAANALDPQNQALYNRLAWQEILRR